MTPFEYDPDILTAFPHLTAAVIFASDMTNSPTSEGLRAAYAREQQSVLANIGDTPLSQLASLAAWRSAFRQFGVNPTKYRSAPEALLRRLTKKGDIPNINALVDLCNLVSIRHTIPIAGMDIRDLSAPLRVHHAQGHERFTTLGNEAVDHPDPGEVIFSDANALVYARRWCWRQSAQSAARPDTTQAIITIEAQHDQTGDIVRQACDEWIALAERNIPGQYRALMFSGD